MQTLIWKIQNTLKTVATVWNILTRRLKVFSSFGKISLNDANDALKEHQERISRVNELLGTQKIELQAANKKINRAHDEMSVQSEISGIIAASLEKEDFTFLVTSVSPTLIFECVSEKFLSELK